MRKRCYNIFGTISWCFGVCKCWGILDNAEYYAKMKLSMVKAIGPLTQYNSAAFVETHRKSGPNSSQRLLKGIDPLVRCLTVRKRSWYRLFTIWAEVERLKISIFYMCSEEKLVWAADKSIKWPPIPYRIIWVSLLLMKLCILLCRRSILSNPP